MYRVVFVEPESPGNVGSLARVMKNFGLSELFLVNPCRLGKRATVFAVHAGDVLEKSKKTRSFEKAVEDCDMVVGSSATVLDKSSTTRDFLFPWELSALLAGGGFRRVALVFGREGDGLRKEELDVCDVVVHVPSSKKYPVLNISHAAAVLFYELFSRGVLGKDFTKRKRKKAGGLEKRVLEKKLSEIVSLLPGLRDASHVSLAWRRVLARSSVSEIEAKTLAGFFGKTLKELKK